MESIILAGVVELRIDVSVSAMMSGLWLSVRSLSAATCSGMSMERVLSSDEEVCGVGGTWVGLAVPTEEQSSGE